MEKVDLCDSIGSLVATLFGNNVENLLHCTTKTLMLETTEVQYKDESKSTETLYNLHFICLLDF